jgi:gliding motility-associated protein GldM
LATEDPGMVNGVKETWEMERVLHVPLAAVVCNLTAVQANIRNAEYEVVNQLLGSISANDFKFDKLVAKVLAEKSYIIAGDEYKADVLLVAFNSTSNPEIEIGNVDTTKAEDVNPMLGAGKPLEVYKGVGKYKAGSSGAGVQTWGGCIKVKQPNGNYKYYPFKSEYEVAPPALVVSPTFMNVFYKGVDNPVDISVPGVPSSSLTVTLEGGGSISPDPVKKGSYNVKIPGNAANKTKVVVSAKIGSAVKRMGEVEFRVKQIPDPVAEIANVKSSGNAPKSLLAQSPLIVRLPGFDFKIPPIAVKKYRFSAVIGGDLKEFSGSGSTLSSDMKSVIEKAKQNSKVIFSDIVVDMPDGRKDVPLNTIVVSIKG